MIGAWPSTHRDPLGRYRAVAIRARRRKLRQRARLLDPDAIMTQEPPPAPVALAAQSSSRDTDLPGPGASFADDLSKRQIMIRLDRAGIGYDPRASKVHLAHLLAEADHGDGD